MSRIRRSHREVLRDKSGLSTSIPDVLTSMGVKGMTIAAVGGILAGTAVLWAVSSASAETSTSFQNTNVAFEKAVHSSDVVVGVGSNKIGLLKDVEGGRCEVQTWQGGSRDGKTTLQLDTKTVAGVCAPTTPLLAAGSSATTRELVFNVKTPAFSFENLGGRTITYNASGAPTLATGAKPAGTKQGDWDDTRPYKVALQLEALDEDAVKVTKKAVATGYTNVVNVTAAADELRYVPSPSDAPIPGPLTITDVKRSTTTGTAYAGAREGVAVTFSGGVCEAVPTKVTVSYAQQSPTTVLAVSTVLNSVLTGDSTTVNLGQVPNGSTGAIEVAAKCVDDGVVVKDTKGFTQQVPATTLTLKQNSVVEKHDLSWIAVSSLPTQFEVSRGFEGDPKAVLGTTAQLTYQSVYGSGENLGMTSVYSVVGIVDTERSPEATGKITTPLPAPGKTTVTGNSGGASWTEVSCPANSTPEYAERHYQQTGTDKTVKWSTQTQWGATRTIKSVTTPGYGRTVYEVQARCAAQKSDAISPTSVSDTYAFYQPEAVKLAVSRSTTVGTAYAGAREGILVLTTGGRCYGDTPAEMQYSYGSTTPGQGGLIDVRTFTPSGNADSYNLAGVKNGAVGYVETETYCTAGDSGNDLADVDYTQTLPKPTVAVKQGVDAEQHVVSWNDLSSLPVTFTVSQVSDSTATNVASSTTTALTKTFDYKDGGTYANGMDYTVFGTVGTTKSASDTDSIKTPWPFFPNAKGIKYTRSSSGDFVDGTVTWSWDKTCPAGTTNGWRLFENRTGQSNGSISTDNRSAMDWSFAGPSYKWAPDYALQGYAYGVRVDGICKSNVTGILTNGFGNVQSSNWVTAMQTPGAPVWDAYNYKEMRRGTDWTYNTPLNQNFQTISIDYKTYCSPGSSMGWSSFNSVSWAGNNFYHPIGFRDYWQLPDGANVANVTYRNTSYACNTPWAESPHSPNGAQKTIQVRR